MAFKMQELAAWTAPSGSLPPFINATRMVGPTGEFVRFTVRSAMPAASVATIDMPADEAALFVVRLAQTMVQIQRAASDNAA